MYEQFLQALSLTYQVYHPFYGFQISMLAESRPATTQEEALAQKIEWLYDINVFGPELVEKLAKSGWRLLLHKKLSHLRMVG